MKVFKFFILNLLVFFYLFNGIALSFENKTSSQVKKIEKPNFVIILADDLGYGDLSCYGSKQIHTPVLDQLALQGVRFLDFHSNGAVCSPTRAALLTGKYQQRTGITGVITAKSHRDVGLGLEERTFAEALKKEGYVSGMFGKWHLGYDVKYNPVHQGFDEFIGYLSGNVDYLSHVDQEGYSDWWQTTKLKNEVGYSTHLITKNANDFIVKHSKQPFVLYIAHEAPHYPYQVPESKADRFPGAVNGVDFPTLGSEKDRFSVYKKMVEILDADVGKILNTLKQLKLDDKTVVIFCSDNGAPKTVGSNGVLKGFKGSVWEGGHRVPAIISWPGHINPGWTSDETVLTMDISPTLVDFTGMKPSCKIDGKSLASYLLLNRPLKSRSVFWQHGNGMAIRKGKWKLIISDENNKPELFDLEKDIEEKVNKANEYPDIVKELLSELNAWKKNVYKGIKKIS